MRQSSLLFRPLLLGVFLTALAPSLHAALPDGGTIRRNIGDKIEKVPDTKPIAPLAPPDTTQHILSTSTLKVQVKSFIFSGVTLFSREVLAAQLSSLTQKELSFVELQEAARKIANFYAAHGYLAQALIPVQDIRDGVVNVKVIEARLGSVEVERAKGVRFSRERTAGFITAGQPSGKVIRLRDLESGLMLLQDMPGIQSSALIRPGTAPSTVDAIVTLEGRPLFSGNAGYDNFGGVATGEHRMNAGLNLNSPLSLGDRLSLKSIYSDGMNYGRALYTLPLGNRGLRAGLSASALTYRLGDKFASLEATGSSFTAGTFLSKPLRLSRRSTLYGSIGYDYRNFIDKVFSTRSGDKSLRSGNLSLSGSWYDDMFRGGYTAGSATVSIGSLDLSKLPDVEQQDLAGPQAAGGYQKLNLSLSRTQQLIPGKLLFNLNMAAQLASCNLDSSEKFNLGGPDGVRAYSTTEGSGDEGMVISAELHETIRPAVQLFGFFDYGLIRQQVKTWDGWASNPGVPNTYSLNGVGIGMLLRPIERFSLKTSLATRLSHNPVADSEGRDHDGTKRTPRFWLEAVCEF